jgi:hypothetical protein
VITAYAILKKGAANANFAGKRLDQKRHDLLVGGNIYLAETIGFFAKFCQVISPFDRHNVIRNGIDKSLEFSFAELELETRGTDMAGSDTLSPYQGLLSAALEHSGDEIQSITRGKAGL